MHKIKTINPIFKENIVSAQILLERKGFFLDIEKFNTLFQEKLELQQKTEKIQSQINKLSKQNKNDPDFENNVHLVKKLKNRAFTIKRTTFDC